MFNQNMLCLPQDRGSSFMEQWQSRTLSNEGWRYMRTKTIRDTRREEIITTARDLFSRKGFHGTSIPDIARAAGISTGLIYYIFSSKEDILLACSEEVAALHLSCKDRARIQGVKRSKSNRKGTTSHDRCRCRNNLRQGSRSHE
jgi:AcrR family transcriptional regulator